MEIELTQGEIAIVDDEDYERAIAYKWHVSAGYKEIKYARTNIKIGRQRTTLSLHRFILQTHEDQEVDHINGDGLDNRKSNLRLCTHGQNQQNCRSFKNVKSKYKGVFPIGDKWTAHIYFNKKLRHLGYYCSENEAAKIYNLFAIKYFGQFARLNSVSS